MRYRFAFGALALSMALAGCDQLNLTNPDAADAPAPAAAAPVVDLVAQTAARGTPIYRGGLDGLVIPPALTASLTPAGNHLVLSGVLDGPVSGGRTGGASFPVPEAVEMAASGNLVRIHVVVSSEADGVAFLAYSTNEVGNSGWMSFPVSREEKVTTLEYDVSAMNLGNGDFIGIDPNGHTLTVKLIAVEVAG
ncbi:hypothetical protein [Hyphomonas sp.]|uniref:hypothetical protein n=1 Tax=Hyphomonas sp. TaxID=87 RepID=UPI00391B1C1D